MSENSRLSYCPNRFLCEFTPSRSRIYAVVKHANGPDVLSAVLTCVDRAVAQQAAAVLNAAIAEGLTDVVHAGATDVEAALPAAPAASFRAALAHAATVSWPVPGAAVPAEEDTSSEWSYSGSMTRSPSGARLGELAGKVVRLVTLREYHVYDQQRLLNTAQARGFEPIPSDEAFSGDPLDIVGAVSYLADPLLVLPGADMVTEMEITSLLGMDTDEVADWSGARVTADFGTGRRLSAESPRGTYKETMWGSVPDFTVMFDQSNCGACGDGEEEHWHMTPRTADVLHTALTVLADEAFDDVEQHGAAPVRRKGSEWMVFDGSSSLTVASAC